MSLKITVKQYNPDLRFTVVQRANVVKVNLNQGLVGPAGSAGTIDFDDINNLPTTLAGYGITDAAAAVHTHAPAAITGYGAAGGYLRSTGSAWARVSGVAWTDLTGVPTTFAPAAHVHAWTDITSGVPATFPPSAHTHAWEDIVSGLPATWAPSAHTHGLADLTDFGAAGGYVRSSGAAWARVSGVAWADLTDVPATFAPSAHTHPASEVTAGTFPVGAFAFQGALSGITTLGLSGQLTSTLATGSAPFVVASTTVVGNLNASLLLGATWAAPAAIGSGTPAAGAFTTLSATGVVTVSAGTALLPALIPTGDPDTGLWFPAGGNNVAISTAGVERVRVNSTGNVCIGTTAGKAAWTFGAVSLLSLESTLAYCGFSAIAYHTAAVGAGGALMLGRSRSAVQGTLTETQSNDGIGYVSFEGVNSSSTLVAGAYFNVTQTGAAGATYIPAAFRFYTSSGSVAPAERLRITSDGHIGIAEAARINLDGVAATGDTYITSPSANVLDLYAGGAKQLSLTATGATVAGSLGGTFITSLTNSSTGWNVSIRNQLNTARASVLIYEEGGAEAGVLGYTGSLASGSWGASNVSRLVLASVHASSLGLLLATQSGDIKFGVGGAYDTAGRRAVLTTTALTLHASHVLQWGSSVVDSPDTNLYRSAANVLKTDDALVVVGTLTTNGGLQTFLANDSAGAGFRYVVVPNA